MFDVFEIGYANCLEPDLVAPWEIRHRKTKPHTLLHTPHATTPPLHHPIPPLRGRPRCCVVTRWGKAPESATSLGAPWVLYQCGFRCDSDYQHTDMLMVFVALWLDCVVALLLCGSVALVFSWMPCCLVALWICCCLALLLCSV